MQKKILFIKSTIFLAIRKQEIQVKHFGKSWDDLWGKLAHQLKKTPLHKQDSTLAFSDYEKAQEFLFCFHLYY